MINKLRNFYTILAKKNLMEIPNQPSHRTSQLADLLIQNGVTPIYIKDERWGSSYMLFANPDDLQRALEIKRDYHIEQERLTKESVNWPLPNHLSCNSCDDLWIPAYYIKSIKLNGKEVDAFSFNIKEGWVEVWKGSKLTKRKGEVSFKMDWVEAIKDDYHLQLLEEIEAQLEEVAK